MDRGPWVEVVAQPRLRPRGRWALRCVAGILLIDVAVAFFAFIAVRDHRALAHGRTESAVVVKVLPAHDWDPLDGGRIVVEWLRPGSPPQDATVWTDSDSSDYQVGEAVTVVRYGTFVRTEDESNDPAPYGFAFAIAGLAGLALVGFAACAFVGSWHARRIAARPGNHVPLLAITGWQPQGLAAWHDPATQFAWREYALSASGYAIGGLFIGFVVWLWQPGGNAQDALTTIAVVAFGSGLVMARRLLSWRSVLRAHAWQEWDASVVEVDLGNATTDYCSLTTTHEGRRYRLVARRTNSTFAGVLGDWSGTLRLCPDTWRTIVGLDATGRMRRFALPRTERTRRRWRRRLSRTTSAAEEHRHQQENNAAPGQQA